MEDENNPRIKELKARLETDPGSRVFYQLGEELRKAKRSDEAEAVLRAGLEKHPSYLSALISLGRVLKESGRATEAVEVLNRAFELDRQNVVVARLLAECYMEMGEDVEAIKKYKLVAALHPADEAVQDRIDEIEGRLRDAGQLEEPAAKNETAPPPREEFPEDEDAPSPSEPDPFGDGEPGEALTDEPDSDHTAAVRAEQPESIAEQSDTSMAGPFEDSAASLGPDEETPLTEAVSTPSPQTAEDESPEDEDVVATITMGDLYARQGHVEQAREIYRKVLSRDPSSEASERLADLDAAEDTQEQLVPENLDLDESSSEARPEVAGMDIEESANDGKIRRLEQWLSRVNR